jgi:DNA repair exonuclease SbcCD nuclease subunit
MTQPGPARHGSRRSRLTLVHTSDVHLENDAFRGAERRSSRRRSETAFRKVIDAAHEEQADLLLIVGDLFDTSRVGSAAIDFVLAELGRVPCPAVLLPGNHDCYDAQSIYRKVDFTQAGPNVHALTEPEGTVLEFPDLHATVWGRPVVDHDDSSRPLAGIPPRRGDAWHLGMAHGLFTEDRHEPRSSLIFPEQIADSGLDYLALGHVHVFREVSQGATKACYPGSPAPLHLGSRHPGSVAVVTLDPASGIMLAERKIDTAEPGP